MKRLFIFALKILPLVTMYKGLTSGGKKFGPIFDIGKVAFTQYELSLIAKEVIEDYKEHNGELIHPGDFPLLINDRYFNNYAKYVRMIFAKNSKDFSYDLWENEYELVLKNRDTLVIMKSSGPDGKLGTKDDIAIDFKIQKRNNYNESNQIAIHAHEESDQYDKRPASVEEDRYWEDAEKSDEEYYEDDYR